MDPIGRLNDFLFPPRRAPRARSIDERAAQLVAQPAESTLKVLTASSLVFYAAEVAQNPKVNSILDAFIYCSTCLSVGYGDIFAMTPVGKMVGTYLMTIGPALSGATLDGPRGEKVDDVVEKEILATLQEILKRMPPTTQP